MLQPFKGPSNKLRQGLSPLPLVRKASGDPCRTFDEALDRWIDFFGQMEGGRRVLFQQQWMTWRQHLTEFKQDSLHLAVADVPSLCEMEFACRHMAAGKASGIDSIPSELCRHCPPAVARHLYSLLLKLCAHGQEALSHKGGYLIPIWKGKQQKDCCESFRSILLSSSLGKIIHKSLRSKQMNMYEQFLQAQQLGGRRGTPVVLGCHQVRAFQRLCAQLRQPSALLFIDLQEAFYRVVRPLVVEGTLDDEHIASMASRLGLDEGFLQDLHVHLRAPCSLHRAGLPDHLVRAISALHTDTFFKLPHQEDQVATHLGSRPGDSFADVIFGYLMASVLHSFQKQMDALGLLCRFPQEQALRLDAPLQEDGPLPFIGPCWMDDLCICLTAPSNEALESALSVASGTILDTFKGLAMTPNLKPGKTAVLVTPCGAGSRRWKTRLFGPVSDGYFHCLGEHHPYRIPLVTGYTHLGGNVHFSGNIKKELRLRVGQAHQEFNKHRTLLYQNRHFGMDKRREMFHSLILSRLLYGAETWVFHDQRSRDYLHGSLIGLFKRLLKCRASTHISDEEVLFRTGLSSPTDLLRARRLRYLGSLCAIGETTCWGLLNRDREWVCLVQDDLKWMWRQLSNTCRLGDPEHHLARWLEIITWHRSYWKRLVRRALEHAIGVQRRQFQVASAHVHLLDRLTHHGFLQRPAIFTSETCCGPTFCFWMHAM